MNLESGQRFSHYEVLERLGSGGMGVVYKARDLRLKRIVALKLLLGRPGEGPEQVRRFLREAESAAALNHPRIAHVYEVDEHEGVPFLAMEFVAGGSLRDRLSQGRPSMNQLLKWSSEVAEALAEAHRHDIVHRDVKPSNVLLDDEGHAKLADFGLAKQLPVAPEGATATRLTKEGVILGTPDYMSPEHALGREVGPPADVFSLGCLMYELVAERPPFERGSTIDTLHAVIHESPAPIREGGLPLGLAVLIEKCLDKQPERRPTGWALLEELRSILVSWRAPSEAPTIVGRKVAPPAARLGRLFLGAALLVLVAAGLGWWWLERPVLDFKERETVMIGGISNATGDVALEGSLGTALQISLEQSPYVNVLSPERIRQALQRMRRGDEEKLSEAVAREICQREGARALITGSVDGLGSRYLVTARIVDPPSGSAVRTLTEQAATREEILPALDGLARALRRALGESLGSIAGASLKLAEATTSSLEALQLFSEAGALQSRGRLEEARSLYERALELDPEFARAYASLATTYRSFNITSDTALAERYFQEALKRLDKVGERERLEIQGLYHGIMGRYQDAAGFYRLLAERYPDVEEYHFYLARQYVGLERHQEAIAEYEAALRRNPRSSRSLIGLAVSYANLGDERAQIRYLEQAFAVEPEWETDVIQNHQYGWALLVTGEEARAREVFGKMLAMGGSKKARGERSFGILALHRGRLTEAARRLEEAARTNEGLGFHDSAARDLAYLAEGLALVGRHDEAVRQLGRAGELLQKLDYRPAWLCLRLSVVWARMGKTAEARKLLDEVKKQGRLENRNDQVDLMRAEGELALSRGAVEEGLESIRRANASWSWWLTRSSLARALVRSGRKEEALHVYEKLLAGGPEPWEGHVEWALVHWSLARLYEDAGETAKARAAYLKLLEVWKEADPDVPPLLEAQRAVRRLSAETS